MVSDKLQKVKCQVRPGSIIQSRGDTADIVVLDIEYDPIADAKYDGKCSRALINGLYWYVDDIVVIRI